MKLVEKVVEAYKEAGLKVVVAESCTGGMIAAELTSISGASEVLERGFVTYSDIAKYELLGVPNQIIRNYGAVSQEVVKQMAQGALYHSHADVSIAVTGIAGPTGGSKEKPVGLVYIATSKKGANLRCEKHLFTGDREAVRKQTVEKALEMLLEGVDTL